jgi:hypothetical protein
VSLQYDARMNLLRALFADVGSRLADLGVRRQPGRSRTLTVPGDRGDALLLSPQTVPSGFPDRAEFMLNISNHLLPWTAYLADVSLEEARAEPPQYARGVYHCRLTWSSGNPAELWAVTADTLDAVTEQLTAGLRRALTTTWLPILPRPDLRALIRGDRPGPGHLRGRPAIVDLMCHIEDRTSDELQEYARFFRSRADADPDLERLANWIGSTFGSGL